MKIFFAALSALLFTALSASAEETPLSKMSQDEFLKAARRPPVRESWASMEGTLTHKRRGSEDIEAKIRMALLFTPMRTVAQLAVADGEIYNVGQTYDASPDSTVVSLAKGPASGSSLASKIGLRPQDITLAFLFWKANPELPRDSFKGQDCRLFVFDSPDASESAKAFLSANYCFPLKVEWTKSGEAKPYRTMEIDSFKKEKDFWLVDSLLLYGPGWKTKLDFSKTKAGLSKDGIPENLFFESK